MTGASRGALALAGLLLATGALLGLSTGLAKQAVGIGLTPLAFLVWSLAGAAVLVAAVSIRRFGPPPRDRRTVEYWLIAAVLTLAAPNLVLFSAVAKVGAGFVALAYAFPPMLTYVGALALRMERFDARRGLGVVLVMAGAAYLAIRKLGLPDAPPAWVVATLAAPMLLAAGNLYRTRRWPPGARAEHLAGGMLAMASALLAGVALMPGFTLAVDTADHRQLLLLAAGAATFGLQYLFFFALQRRGGPVYLSFVGSVAALVGVPLAVFWFGEDLPPGLSAGGALTVAGIALVVLGGRRGAPTPPDGR